MGVTYWQIGEKDHAIDLTLNGAELVEKAVDGGVLPKKSLAVPYGNLADDVRAAGREGRCGEVLGAGEVRPAARRSRLWSPTIAARAVQRMRPTMTIGQRQTNWQSSGQRQMAGQQPTRQPMQRTAQQSSGTRTY